MKKLLFFFTAILLLASCNKTTSNLTNAIPSNASIVICINGQSLINKAHYNPLDSSAVQQILPMLKTMLGSKDKEALLDDVLKDVNSCGLNIKGDSFYYQQGDTMGIVIGVNDKNKLQKMLTTFAFAPKGSLDEKDDVASFTQRGISVAFDKEKLLIISSKSYQPKDFSKLVVSQIKQDAAHSVSSNEALKELVANKKDISLAMLNLANLKSNVNLSMLQGVQKLIYLSFEKGEVVIKSKYTFADKKAKAKYDDLASKLSAPINGKQLEHISDNPTLAYAANINGEALYDLLKSMLGDKLDTGNNKNVSMKTIMGNISGDITLSLDYDKKPTFIVMADIKDSKVYEKMIDSTATTLKKLSSTSYIVDSDSKFGDIHITLENNLLCITNQDELTSGKTEFDAAKGGYMLLHFSTDKLAQFADEDEIQGITTFVSMIEGIDGESNHGADTGDIRIKFKNKDKNSLAVLCSYLDANKESLYNNLGRSILGGMH